MKNLKWAGCVGIMAVVMGVATPAFAAQGNVLQATAVTITSSRSVTTPLTGSPVTFRAAVSPSLIAPRIHITGTVSWTITGSDGSAIACSKVSKLSPNGRSSCIVKAGQVESGASAYTVTASYTGDGSFATSSSTFDQTVAAKPTRVLLHWAAPLSGGGANTATITIKAGTANRLVSGTVAFLVFSQSKGFVPCTNGTENRPANSWSVALGSNGDANNVASCEVPAGWLTVPQPSSDVRHPKADWGVTVSFQGDPNFGSVIERGFRGDIHS